MRIYSKQRDRSGFTLIEVMIAVVVLATGLLALAVLQAKLASSAADAKARSRIVALITSVIDKERALGYGNIAAFSGLTASAGACLSTTDVSLVTLAQKVQNDINCAQSDAGVSGISMTQTVTRYYGAPSAGSFTTTAPGASVSIYGDYKQIKLKADWTDATGAGRSLAADTITSNLGLNANASVVLSQNLTITANMTPVVHELNPGNTAGVIPIAIGSAAGQYAASTNPKPTVSSSGANSTTFNTLNYASDANASTATIQKRVETEVAECVCKGSNSNPFGNDTLFGQNTFRPTYWNGNQYASPAIVSGGVPKSSAATSVTQSPECDICCRDHNDTGIATTDVRYDAVTGDTKRYKVKLSGSNIITPIALAVDASGNPVPASVTSDAYIDACRFIRVDGLWRTATDIQASQVGLIATNDEQGVAIDKATPYAANQTLYATFVVNAVKSFLSSALPTAGSPEWSSFLTNTLASIFSTQAPDVPTTTPVVADTKGTYRYLHAHGLYIDHLETEALNKLNAVVSSSCKTTDANYPKCLLAYVPFSTINIGGLATWTDARDSSDAAGLTPLLKTVLQLGAGTSTSSTCASGAFFGGCVLGLTAGYADAKASIGHSNSGIAVSIPVSPYELDATKVLSASQRFTAGSTTTSDLIYTQIFGPDLTPSGFSSIQQFPSASLNSNINPKPTWATNGANGNCSPNAAKKATSPNPYNCSTTVALVTPTTITVSGYNQAVAVAAQSAKDPCNVGGSSKNKTYPVPGLICYRLNAVTLTTDLGTGTGGTARIDCNATPTPASCYGITSPYTVAGSKTAAETTAVTISAVTGTPVPLSNTYLNLTYVANGSALGTVSTSSCATTNAPTITAPTSCP